MKLQVITPVGPLHKRHVKRAMLSVKRMQLGPFKEIEHVVREDDGRGRSATRNSAMGAADWYFFLDADDIVERAAATRLNTKYSATFGAVKLAGKVAKWNVYPCTWADIKKYGARGTLVMGCFVKAEVARALRFNEAMAIAEDFDFYMRLPDFYKSIYPLIDINYFQGKGTKTDWTGECRKVIDGYARTT